MATKTEYTGKWKISKFDYGYAKWYSYKYLEWIGFQTLGEESPGGQYEIVRFDIVAVEILRHDAVDRPVVDMCGHCLVSGKIGSTKSLIAPLEKTLGADSRHGRGHGTCKNDLCRDLLTDFPGYGDILETEYLWQDNGIFVFQEDADLADSALPGPVENPGDLE